jgi:mRNA interferase RelE/StbE
MILKISRSFEKDTDKISDQTVLDKISEMIDHVEQAATIRSIKNSKKLTGFKEYYRIRIGDYRIGLIYRNQEVIFTRFHHRKEIYKYFP